VEQARFVDELHTRYGLAVSDIAERLERSRAWVSVRLGIIGEMSEVVRKEIFSGRFPLRCYMYTLRQFTRVNSISSREVESFVRSVSGRGLSTRDIETLAYGYFRGGKSLRCQIEEGNPGWTLRQMRKGELGCGAEEGLSEVEWSVIRDLELAQKYISRICCGLSRNGLASRAFHARAVFLIERLLDKIELFEGQLRSFHESRAYKRDR